MTKEFQSGWSIRTSFGWWRWRKLGSMEVRRHTVDGRNPAPVDMVNINSMNPTKLAGIQPRCLLGCPKMLVNEFITLKLYTGYWGYDPLIPTIDPNSNGTSQVTGDVRCLRISRADSTSHNDGSFRIASGRLFPKRVVQLPRLKGMKPSLMILLALFFLVMAPPPLQSKKNTTTQKQLICICENNRLLVM